MCQPSLHQQPEMREMLYKRYRWFYEDPQPADMSSSTSSHQRNRSRTSPKQLYRDQAAKLRKKVLPTTVFSLIEVESDFGQPQTPAASNNATQVIVQPSFPPNLIPREKRPGDEVAFHPVGTRIRSLQRDCSHQQKAGITTSRRSDCYNFHKACRHLKLLTSCVSTTCHPPILLKGLEHLGENRE